MRSSSINYIKAFYIVEDFSGIEERAYMHYILYACATRTAIKGLIFVVILTFVCM